MKKDFKILNDCLYRGRVMLPDLCGILLRFCMHNVAVVADIQEASLELGLHEKSRDVTRFLWLKDLTKNVQKDSRFIRVVFGRVFNLFLLAATSKHHLKEEEKTERRNGRTTHTKTLKDFIGEIYVDNFITGLKNSERAGNLYQLMKDVLHWASVNLLRLVF